ncbi:MAG: DUF2905 family protein [Lysobacterales bacterium]|nr:MAG: DUF2905 family protein [Xanthomonadales bacterium]
MLDRHLNLHCYDEGQTLPTLDSFGRWLVVIGLTLALLGLLLFLLGKLPFANRLGHLPGDIVYQDQARGITCAVPIVSSLLLSLLLTIILNVIARLFRK